MGKAAHGFSEEEMKAALKTIASMDSKIKKVQTHFEKGTSQHTLAKNRLKAFRISTTLIKKSLKEI